MSEKKHTPPLQEIVADLRANIIGAIERVAGAGPGPFNEDQAYELFSHLGDAVLFWDDLIREVFERVTFQEPRFKRWPLGELAEIVFAQYESDRECVEPTDSGRIYQLLLEASPVALRDLATQAENSDDPTMQACSSLLEELAEQAADMAEVDWSRSRHEAVARLALLANEKMHRQIEDLEAQRLAAVQKLEAFTGSVFTTKPDA